jgi:hypothetical protein
VAKKKQEHAELLPRREALSLLSTDPSDSAESASSET